MAKSKSPKVSVIAGAYNIKKSEANLAIKSILKQSFSDFEFIICDDGLSDDDHNFLIKISKSDPRVKIIRNQSNVGLGRTLNRCLKEASGQYIARMDMDDYSPPDRLQKQVDFLDKNDDFAIVSCCAFLFDEDYNQPYGELILPEFPQKKDMLFNSPFVHAGAMIRSSSLKKIGGYRIAKETRRAEDYDLWMRMYAADMVGYNIQERLYGIREDREAYARRKYKYRIDEAIVRYKGFKNLDLFPKGYFYVVKPLVVGLIPGGVLKKIRGKNVKK